MYYRCNDASQRGARWVGGSRAHRDLLSLSVFDLDLAGVPLGAGSSFEVQRKGPVQGSGASGTAAHLMPRSGPRRDRRPEWPWDGSDALVPGRGPRRRCPLPTVFISGDSIPNSDLQPGL